MKKWERKDLKKYNAESKVISFRSDASYEKTGTEARNELRILFADIIQICDKQKLLALKDKIISAEKILAMSLED
jgi:hypothetical protein